MSNRNRTTTVVLIALVLAFTALGIWFGNREDDAREEEISPAAAAPDSSGKGAALAKSAPNMAREEISAPPASASGDAARAPAEGSTGAALRHFQGRVVDIAGNGVPNLEITVRNAPLVVFARSRGDGSFEFDGSTAGQDLFASSTSFATVRALSSRNTHSQSGIIVVAPVIAVSGFVVDENGIGLGGALVTSHASDDLLAHFPLPLDSTLPVAGNKVECDAGGAFSLPRSISVEGAELWAEFEGLERVTMPAPSSPRSDVRFVLKKKPGERMLTGVVLRANGDPATRAKVRIGEAEAATDTHGAFQIAVPDWIPNDQPLVAIESGSQAASVPDFGRIVEGSTTRLEPVRLVLGPAPLSIRGRVIDAQGHPLQGFVVALVQGTPVSVGRVPAITAEALTADIEGRTTSDVDGTFEIQGLLDREYSVCAYSAVSLARIESKPVKAGTHDLELVLGADAFEPLVTGRVIALDGTPIAGAELSIGLVTGREQGATGWISGKSTQSKADGAFAFEGVPRRFAQIDVDGDQVIPITFALEGVDLSRPVSIQVSRRCHFRVEGLPASTGRRLMSARGADGGELAIMMFQSGGWSSTNRQEVTADTTRVYAVGESAVDLVLYDMVTHEADKRPMHLVPGDVTVVRW